MATCNIDLYKCGITKDRNAKIDSLKDFLLENSTQHIERKGVQRIRHAMKISIKLDISQSEADYQGVDYCQIENTDSGRRYYYFIDSCMQLAQRTVQFNLTLDTINTFFDEMTFTNRTFVEREHKDRFERFVKSSGHRIDYARRKIDRISEGNAPLKFLKKKEMIASDEPNIFLVYRSNENITSESTGIVNALAYASTPTTYSLYLGEFTTPTSQTAWHTYAIIWTDNTYEPKGQNEDGDSIELSDSSHGVAYTISKKGMREYGIIYNQGKNYVTIFWRKYPIGATKKEKVNLGFTPTKIKINAKMYYFNESATYEGTGSNISNYTDIETGTSLHTPKFIEQLDRADSKLIKIIALPYAPFSFTSDYQGYITPSGWRFNTNNEMQLDDQNAQFEHPIYVFNFEELYTSLYGDEWGNPEYMRDDSLESKIYHSDFYARTLVYDSFARPISLERLKKSEATTTPTRENSTKVTLYFKPTNTINSKFAFKFKFYEGEYVGFYWLDYDMVEPFENYLICERNNELTIYSNNYLNYLRTGYNYDIKNKNLQTFQTLFGGASGLASNITMATISGNYAGAAIGTASSIASVITSSISQQNAFEQKQLEMKQQSTGVSGSNDLDLLQYYSNNKAFDCTYELSKEQKNNFLNLFYYCGYAVNEMRKPIFANRYWFNFLKCNPQFTNVAAYITNDYITDISNRLQEGVTIYHEHNGKWDFEQVLENWETWMV